MRIHRLAMIVAIPFMLVTLALTNCGSSNNNTVGIGGHTGTAGFTGGVGVGGGGGTAVTDAGSSPDTVASAAVISIQNFTWVPADLTVAPGATITVTNNDSVAHTVTSQSAPRLFVPGAVNGVAFSTGIIPPNSTATITIPANAPSGTVVPYFCSIHRGGMANDGQITIQ